MFMSGILGTRVFSVAIVSGITSASTVLKVNVGEYNVSEYLLLHISRWERKREINIVLIINFPIKNA